MKNLVLVLFIALVLVLILPFTEGKSEKRSLEITSLTINFNKADATFTVNYDFGSFPKLYILLLGSKGIEPKIQSVFSNFDYKIIKMDQDKAILRVKNISRLDKGYYLHDTHIKFGEGIKSIYIYTPDSPDPKKYSNQYLFSWDNVPGNESFKLLTFLKDLLDIDRLENAKILKPDKDKTISVLVEDKSAEITLDRNKRKALMEISDGRTYELQVKEENGKFDVYSPYLYSTPNIYYRS